MRRSNAVPEQYVSVWAGATGTALALRAPWNHSPTTFSTEYFRLLLEEKWCAIKPAPRQLRSKLVSAWSYTHRIRGCLSCQCSVGSIQSASLSLRVRSAHHGVVFSRR